MSRVAHGRILTFKPEVLTKNKNERLGQNFKTKKIFEQKIFHGRILRGFLAFNVFNEDLKLC